jgi:diaminohydroxyphosphoribosylaminopyrimidine deaminase / 5-amino-6-(5-phosphoribosylamino)uracil reductase
VTRRTRKRSTEKARSTAAAEKVAAKLAEKHHVPVSGVATKVAAKAAQTLAATEGVTLRSSAAARKQVTTAAAKQRDARTQQNELDDGHMRHALALAETYRGRTAPNPIVGCVIVDAVGVVLAEGVHRGPGTKHAEIDALDKLGGKAPGGTLYVNLEPCMHEGRTPPCAPVVAGAGLARVVVGSEDPIEGHRGGMAYLKKHGVTVTRALTDECDHANLPFMRWALSRQPAFTLKAAITIDGKIATVTGESQWITGEAARSQVHVLRNTHDAVMVGIETVLADDPKLTARIEGARDPIRIVVDSRLRTPLTAKLLPKKNGPRTIIATTSAAPAKAEAALARVGAEVWRFPAEAARVPLVALADRLAEESIQSVLVEGGGQIHASLLEARLATDVRLFLAPLIVGGPAPTWVGGAGVSKLSSAWRLQFIGDPLRVGDDLLIQAVVRYQP